MEPFKNEFSHAKAERIARAVAKGYRGFRTKRFLAGLEAELEPLELKERMSLIADRLEMELPGDVPQLFEILVSSLAKDELDEAGLRSFAVWPLTEIVARRGHGHFEESMRALEEMTKRFSAEFAIRPFIRQGGERTMKRLAEWCAHPSEHVRRLVSEGSRPLLPWGGNLPELFEKPYPTLVLLEKLHRDPSPYVRLSVSNHLNDFSKRHPDLVVATLQRWIEAAPGDPDLQKLSRHACRTLLKQGHEGAMGLQGYGAAKDLEVSGLALDTDSVELGGSLGYSLRITNRSRKPVKVMCDYAIHLLKANGTHSTKVFKGRNKVMAAGEAWEVTGRQSFKPVTTRVYHPGLHRFEPRVNGRMFAAVDFRLEIPD